MATKTTKKKSLDSIQLKKRNIKKDSKYLKKNQEYIKEYNRYVFIIVVILGLFTISWLGFNLGQEVKDKMLRTSYLVKKRLIKEEYDLQGDLTNLKKLSGDYYIYISNGGDEKIYDMEKNLAKIIKEYDLKDKIYYLNIDSVKTEYSNVKLINELLELDDIKVEKVPTIIYVNKDGKILRNNIITRIDDSLMEAGDFQKLLDINDIKKP